MPALSAAQLAALKAAADGKLSRLRGFPYSWRGSNENGSYAPRSATCDALIERGLIALDFEHWDSARWVTALVTAAGRAVLDNHNPDLSVSAPTQENP